MSFISVGSDNLLKCWDEIDGSENFQLKMKQSSEVSTFIQSFIHKQFINYL